MEALSQAIQVDHDAQDDNTVDFCISTLCFEHSSEPGTSGSVF